MDIDRDWLVRKTFELDRDLAYRTFRRLHFDLPEVVRACPEPAVRE